jgi:hypothetical protein
LFLLDRPDRSTWFEQDGSLDVLFSGTGAYVYSAPARSNAPFRHPNRTYVCK